MSDSENFIRRWSRRKRKASDEKTPRDQTSPRQAASPGSPQGDASKSGQPAAAGPDIPEFDPASLPPVDAIKADTDITAFMRAGVPAELRHAALRRAWSADAAIRDFVGLNENYWNDVTGQRGVAGFGDLDPGVNIKQMVSELLGENREKMPQSESNESPPAPPATDKAGSQGKADLNTSEISHSETSKIAATQNSAATEATEPRPARRHGGALPE